MYPQPSLPTKPLSRGGIPLGKTEKYRGLDSHGVTMCEEFPPPRGVRPRTLKRQPASTTHWGVKQTPQAATICLSKACPKPLCTPITLNPPPCQLPHSNGVPTAWLTMCILDVWALPTAWLADHPALLDQKPGSETRS